LRLNPSAPAPLQEKWWTITEEEPGERALKLHLLLETSLDAESDAKREISMRLRLIPGGKINTLEVRWAGWPDAWTQLSEQIVTYTIDELRLALMARARVKNPQASNSSRPLQSHFAKTGAETNATSAQSGTERRFLNDPIVAKTFWPSPQDYNEALQNPAANFELDVLKAGTPETTALGLPKAASGAFASVYKLKTPSKDYAIKCFLTMVSDQQERYELISKSILNDDLEYTVDFEFLPKGILVQGKWYPILRMDWVTGTPLNFWVEQHLSDSASLLKLADEFVEMSLSLKKNGIAHGDLQHGNILVTGQGIRLVDYDGMFVPGMDGMVSNEIGHRNYQHPLRHPTDFGVWLDNFSAWMIYLSLRMLARDSSIWKLGAAGDESLIFRQNDFLHPDQSPTFQAISKNPDEQIQDCLATIRSALETPLPDIPSLAEVRF
jgi:hypothetical protein